MNETLNKFIAIMGNQEAARNVAPPPPVSPPFVTTPHHNPPELNQASPVILMEIEHKGVPSSHPVSCIFHSQHRTSLMSRCTSTGHYPTYREDARRALPSTFYSRSCGQGRCASHHGGISLRNLHRCSARRTM
jgi:hypothetical protein